MGMALLAAPAPARADILVPGAPDTNGIRGIGKGVKEIGVESLLLLDYNKAGGSSSLRASTVTGLSFRYFILNNLNLALNASYFYKGDDAASRQGGVFTLGAATVEPASRATGARGMIDGLRQALGQRKAS